MQGTDITTTELQPLVPAHRERTPIEPEWVLNVSLHLRTCHSYSIAVLGNKLSPNNSQIINCQPLVVDSGSV